MRRVLLLLCLFAGAVGKSGQFPLHVWLPDAMEGPTPVSALIHAATMVAAGVYLVARTYPLFEAVPQALTVVAIIGGFTAIFAASMGFGYGWYPEERIRGELQNGTLKPLPLREGSERVGQLYLVYADRESAGPGTLRLAQIIQQVVKAECASAAVGTTS